jgi:glycosidase
MSQAEGVAASAARGVGDIAKFTKYVESYQAKVQAKNPGGMAISFLSNHDMDRIAGAFVTENNMKMAANLYLLSPGSPVIYYGEEIGMRGSRGSANTDANRRLAMLWGDDDLIKDPVGSTYPEKNQIKNTVAEQSEDELSLLSHYRRLLTVRHTYPAIARGQYTAISGGHKNLGGFLVEYEDESLLIIHNTSTEELVVDIASITALSGMTFKMVTDCIGVGIAKLNGTRLTVAPQTSVIVK